MRRLRTLARHCAGAIYRDRCPLATSAGRDKVQQCAGFDRMLREIAPDAPIRHPPDDHPPRR